MNRRSFFKLLSCLPFVGGWFKKKEWIHIPIVKDPLNRSYQMIVEFPDVTRIYDNAKDDFVEIERPFRVRKVWREKMTDNKREVRK